MILMTITFFILLILGMPLAFSIGISSILVFAFNDSVPLIVPVQKMISATQSYPLLAILFFVLAGNLMNHTGITKRLVHFCYVVTRHLIGGMAHVTILLSALMGGISGSAVADVAMQSRLLGSAMDKRGYSKGYAAASISLSGLITATIPPSIGLILYGFVGEVSIGKLFLAGIMPGILMTIFLMISAYLVAKKRGYDEDREEPAELPEVLKSLNDAKWALIFPLILIVGIRFGVFTPSEAGAFAVMYAFFIGFFVYKELTMEKVYEALSQTVLDTGVILFIISVSGIFGYAIIYYQVPQAILGVLLAVTENSTLLLIIILTFLFIAGMFMESTINVLLLTPIFMPIIKAAGIDPVHFGIMMMTLVTMGAMTPPVGVAMFTACSILECSIEEYIKECIPFIVAILLLVVFMLFFPGVVMFIPNLVYR